MTGITANSSTYPCAYCTAIKSNLGTDVGVSRTLGSISEWYGRWLASGGNEKDAKLFFNCINKPLFCGDDNTKVLQVCPPPSLHLILGLTNSAYDVIAKHHQNAAELWAKSVNATRHAQFGFAGRHCRALLSKHGVLMEAGLTEYADCMEKLLSVVQKCFGFNLEDGYRNVIQEFCSSWTTLNLPVTPKFHILKYHVSEFCDDVQSGLGRYSEQTVEAIHQDFSNTWKVPESHANYQESLLKAVVVYNSSHI